jgi:hypothetical protein
MIPKVIHYCWFGRGKLPKSAVACIESWKLHFPGYLIKEWNESNFDVNIIPYTRDAYNLKKYAFVSDFARFWILYHEGGVYFDTDVEVVGDMSSILADGPFMGFEINPLNNAGLKMRVNPGLGIAANYGHSFYKKMIEFYKGQSFVVGKGVLNEIPTVVDYTTSFLVEAGLLEKNVKQNVCGINIYLEDVLCPISIVDGRMRLTDNTRSIHWFDQSWQSPWRKYTRKVVLKVGGVPLKNFFKVLHRLKY